MQTAPKTRHRTQAVFELASIVFLAMCLLILQKVPGDQKKYLLILIACMVAGYALLLLSRSNLRVSQWLIPRLERFTGWLRLFGWQTVLFGFAFGFSLLAYLASGDGHTAYSPIIAVLSWLIAVLSCSAAFWSGERLSIPKSALLVAAGMTCAAFLLRGIYTRTIPISLTGDEAAAGRFSVAILKGEFNNPFISGWYDFPALFFYLPALSISWLGNTTEALRIPAAIAGALSIGAIFLTTRSMFGMKAALASGIAMIGFDLHIHFSRIGLNNVWDGFFFASTTGAMWYAWEHESRKAFLLAGIGAGLSQYFYTSSRALFALVLLFWGISALLNPSKFRRCLPDLLLSTCTALVIVLPLGLYYIKHPDSFMAAMNRVTTEGKWLSHMVETSGLPAWRVLLNQFGLGLQSFFLVPLRFWYAPGTPFLRPFYAVFFVIGLIYLLVHPKDSRTVLLLTWIALTVTLLSLSDSTPASQRMVMAVPLAMILVGSGIDHIVSNVSQVITSNSSGIMAGIGLIALLISAEDAFYYFNTYIPRSRVQYAHENTTVAQGIANELIQAPPGTKAYLYTVGNFSYQAIPSIPYLAPQVEGIDVFDPWDLPEVNCAGPNVFIFLPGTQQKLGQVQQHCPGGNAEMKMAADQKPLLWLYRVGEAVSP